MPRETRDRRPCPEAVAAHQAATKAIGRATPPRPADGSRQSDRWALISGLALPVRFEGALAHGGLELVESRIDALLALCLALGLRGGIGVLPAADRLAFR